MLKKIARKILKNEIEKLKQEKETQSKEYWDLINEHTKKEYEHTNQIKLLKEQKKRINELEEKLRLLEKA